MKLHEATVASLLLHARTALPQEAVGFVLVDGNEQRVLMASNVAPDPTTRAIPDAFSIRQAARSTVLAMYHSHPSGGPPSRLDRRGATISQVPIVVVSGDVLHVCRTIKPIIGRDYQWGVYDCQTLVWDWYLREHGVELVRPDRPETKQAFDDADFDWVEKWSGECGFYRIPPSRPLRGDVLSYRIHSHGYANHLAVYIGDNYIVHHPYRGLSVRDDESRWDRFHCTTYRWGSS